MTDALSMWTVYERPLDYPEKYVARRFEIDRHANPRPTPDVFTADSLDAVRSLIPPGLHRLARWPGDEPHIVEVWV